MNFVTYETAVRLKEAGFPQPESKSFQVWYNTYNGKDLGTAAKIQTMSSFIFPEPENPFFIDGGCRLVSENCVYAPTAEDILQQLPNPEDYKATFDGVLWHIQHYTGYSTHENFAEAVALAWFEYFGK